MFVRGHSPEQGKIAQKAKLLARVLKTLDSSVVIVEGKKDEAALQEIGVKGRILQASGRVRGICEKVKADEAVILTDNDLAGKELAELVRDELEACNIRVDLQVRRDLRHVLGARTVEEVPRKLKEFEEKLRLKGK
ncbi:MAG: toprim domain-containing protein [Candidatus Micrarchaeia archaeon]